MRRSRGLLSLLLIAAFFANVSCLNQCLTTLEEVSPKREARYQEKPVNITFGISKRVTTQRLVSRIAKIYLEEALGFSNVELIETDDEFDLTRTITGLSGPRTDETPKTMINMEVWVPSQFDVAALTLNSRTDESNYSVIPVGSVTYPGHFGWFVPDRLSRQTDTWVTFTKQETAARFAVSEASLRKIMNATRNDEGESYCRESFCQNGMYIPAQCLSQSKPCAMLLSDYSETTKFVKDHIDHWKLYAQVAWLGPNLRQIIKALTKEYLQQQQQQQGQQGHTANPSATERSLVIVHWTPSNVIPNEREFVNVVFPRCGTRGANMGCAYETKILEKLMWGDFPSASKLAYESIKLMEYGDKYETLISKYNEKLNSAAQQQRYNSDAKLALIEQDVACDWLRDNLNYSLDQWMPKQEDKSILYVGGIFPMTGTFYTAKSIVLAAQMARQAINANATVLRDYNLQLILNDGQCKSDMVMKAFIDYILLYRFHKLIGILGPACSETIEPLAGVSRHYHTAIMSYGAEGSGFSDRDKYPYLFRTIGENRQYKYVYSQLLNKLNWHRVAAFSEDGLKYTEYISYMQDMLRENGITFVANIKFPREWKADSLTKYLEDLKQKRARIIISDVYDQVARQVMCEAYRLEMTAAQGYVWFLPQWLKDDWFDVDTYNAYNEQTPCSTAEMKKAIDGHLSISHANFAPDDSIMQEGLTVRQWRDNYETYCSIRNEPTSPYAGYAYDAMWVYAYATDTLLKENPSQLFELHSEATITRFIEIIKATDFYGVSGRIKFVDGPSRFPVINVYQHVGGRSHIVGSFHPNISEETNQVIGGNLDLNTSAIVWLSGKKPDDGSEPPKKCIFSGFAELLNVSCEGAIVIVNIIGFGLLGMFLLVIVIFIKRKYDQKVRAHEKYMKSLGLDLLQPDTSSLDKWEIPREQVVINRKLGEGAFGTVYGGEAFFPEKGWLAVAVKTLKVGSSTEEKLNFLSEVEVMKRFEHKNIIKLLAVCIKGEPVLTVMEFMLYGDLKTYLLARRHLVNDQHYEDSDEISNKRLTAMALDVARALSYLAQLKYVHRDVASRNCLVNAQRICKLGDFGMTRPMYENDYYKFNRKGMLPVRWMAPESLGLGIFTPASDVWSYGVLLYEIITFGSFPFQGMSNNQVLTHVKAGNSLTVPKGVKQQLEGLIKSCWSVDHTKRPTAPEIVDFLATNQRVIAPCLDVPLASVQLEHTGQMEMQLSTTADRKFSFPWPGQSTTANSSSAKLANDKSIDAPLLDIDEDLAQRNRNIDAILSGASEHAESSKPLLGDTTDSGLGSGSSNSDDAARYVNMQPGVTSAFLDLPSGDSISCSIPMSERLSPTTNGSSTDFNSMSFL